MIDFKAMAIERADNRTEMPDENVPIESVLSSTGFVSKLIEEFLKAFPEAKVFHIGGSPLPDGMARVAFFMPLDGTPYCQTSLDC
ncbi:hypothetical protein ACIKP9_00135 [Methylobacillus methanolivorans]|uniref:Uncharacterized protein n=1 Tax=Methylobacillus methanolivorans TaxID=1848927 RepID=A0ABW8GHQ5_9PROT